MKNIKDEYTVREIGKHLGLDPRRTQQLADDHKWPYIIKPSLFGTVKAYRTVALPMEVRSTIIDSLNSYEQQELTLF
jgi:hypothetical protein